MPDRLTTAQTAQRLGCAPRTVTRWVEAGLLQAADKFPGETGGYLFDADEVERRASVLAAEMERDLAKLRGEPAEHAEVPA
jgi:DNA-binding transcriptional MerR regulator